MKIPFSIAIIASVCISSPSLFGCKKETIVETEVVTETITDTVFTTDSVNVTQLILVRHAEKSSVGTDPDLTTVGLERADQLALVLSQIELDRVYSTNYNRTMQTAAPTAADQGLTITNYGGFDHLQVIDDILVDVHEGKVLIVGHGNTTANFLNALTGTSDYMDIPETEYDNLYIVNTRSLGDSDVIHLKY